MSNYMTINIKPSDVVKRGLWDTYVYYVVGSEKDAEQLLLKDEEFILSERDAIVIGLLKVMETDNLIHRFNDYITHFLSVKSNKEGDGFYIKIKSIEHAIEVGYYAQAIQMIHQLKKLCSIKQCKNCETLECNSCNKFGTSASVGNCFNKIANVVLICSNCFFKIGS